MKQWISDSTIKWVIITLFTVILIYACDEEPEPLELKIEPKLLILRVDQEIILCASKTGGYCYESPITWKAEFLNTNNEFEDVTRDVLDTIEGHCVEFKASNAGFYSIKASIKQGELEAEDTIKIRVQ